MNGHIVSFRLHLNGTENIASRKNHFRQSTNNACSQREMQSNWRWTLTRKKKERPIGTGCVRVSPCVHDKSYFCSVLFQSKRFRMQCESLSKTAAELQLVSNFSDYFHFKFPFAFDSFCFDLNRDFIIRDNYNVSCLIIMLIASIL